MNRLFVTLVLFCAGAGLSGEAHAETFRWLNQEQDQALWARVHGALSRELAPDAEQQYKYLVRVGVYEDAALVVLGERDTPGTESFLDRFRAVTLDLRHGTTQPIGKDFFLFWRFSTLAHLDHSAPPEFVFTHEDCVECESKSRLSSFRYDPRHARWTLRAWPSAGTDLLIDGADMDSPADDYLYTCVHAIRDFTGDGLDDIAIWCRKVGQIHGSVTDTVFLYTTHGGRPQRRVPTGARRTKLQHAMCVGHETNSLCQGGSTHHQ